MYLLVVGVEPVLVFSLRFAIMYWLICIRPAADLPIPRLVLSFPSPPIGREHCLSPAQNSPYGWWYLVLVCWAWSAYFSLVVLLAYSESHFWPQHLVSGPAVSSTRGSDTVDVELITTPRDDEVDNMPVPGTRMHPSGLAFILLLEHGFRHYQFQLRAQSQ